MSSIIKLSDCKRHSENPFVEKAIEEVNGSLVKKYRTASNQGEQAVLRAVDDKGEILGHTTFVRQIEVDETQFAKVYLSQFSAFFDLGPQAIKVFGYIMQKLVPKKDSFSFYIDECMEYTGYTAKASIYKGVAELVNAEIIARGKYDTKYFINPLIVFNGDRVSYVKSYVKKKKKKKNPNQTDLFLKD